MQPSEHVEQTAKSSEVVAKRYDPAGEVEGDQGMPAARGLERVLWRAANLRLEQAIAELARELKGARSNAPSGFSEGPS